MDKLRLVLVGTEGAVNLGMIARLADNFDVDELYLVSPKASLDEAREYAVRAAHRLDEAVIVQSLEEALEGASLRICTSGKSSERDPLRIPVTPRQAAEIASTTQGTVALVMGRESVGLTRRELGQCDLLSTIPASPRYPVLNLANATAIMLYEFYLARRPSPGRAKGDPRFIRLLEAYARALAGVLVTDPRKREDIVVAVRRLASKALVHEREIQLLLYLLSRACARIEGCMVEAPTNM